MTSLIIYKERARKHIYKNVVETDVAELKSSENYDVGSHTEFLKIPSTKIGGKTVLEWFSVGDISYWWFIAPMINPTFNENAYFVDNLLSRIEKYSIELIELRAAFDKLALIKKICEEKNIRLKISGPDYFTFGLKQYARRVGLRYAYKRIMDRKIKKRLQLYKKKKLAFEQSSELVVFTTHGLYRRDLLDDKTGEIKRQEFFIQPFLDLLTEQKLPFIAIDIDYTFKGTTKILEERLNSSPNWVPIEILINGKKSEEVKNLINSLKNSVSELLKHKHDNDGLTYKGIPILNYFGTVLDEIFFEPHLPTYIHLLLKAEEFLSTIKARIVIQVYEHGPYAKAFEFATKQLNIRTIAIQHGLFTETTHDYMFRELRTDVNPLGNPVADVTCVFGEYFKKILIEKGSYSPEKVVVIGNPIFYNIDKKIEILKIKKIREKSGFSNSTIILVPLSNFRLDSKDSYDFVVLDTLNKGLRDTNDFIIMVRGHPARPISKNMLDKLFPGNNFVVSTQSLFEDIFISDVVVTAMSTIGIDATIFRKPVIFVNVTENLSLLGEFQQYMFDHKVAKVCSKDNFVSEIFLISKGQWFDNDFTAKREFLQSFFNYGVKVDLMKVING